MALGIRLLRAAYKELNIELVTPTMNVKSCDSRSSRRVFETLWEHREAILL